MHPSIPNAEAVGAACGVAGHALLVARAEEIAALRDGPVPAGAPTLPPRFLRHSDEQTVVGLRAVLAAMAATAEPHPTWESFGVVAAACRAGRLPTAQSLVVAREGGGVAVSPHVVPQCSLHAPAGAVSVALGMHGPNVGVAGGRYAVSEGLVTSLSLLASGLGPARASLPGIWLVLTSWTDEPALDDRGRPASGPVLRGLAVALLPEAASTGVPRLVLRGSAARLAIHAESGAPTGMSGIGPPGTAAGEIARLAAALDAGAGTTWAHRCPWGAEIRLEPAPLDARRSHREAA
jgi:hypothetical protein